ncbi:spermidine synthase [Uliginosibacterium sp. H3]|uniref:Spermidine synthase n=1 Tax=Uliginosibacterium silvisoli TaxID=3114758 RepID=A0ABU6K1S6_9RHOO|nr:spermidine synthase [Uliginosibacterium sp. H3]
MRAAEFEVTSHAASRLASRIVFAGTIFISAFALFLVQPIIAKQILPWFGGSAAVWAICMVFFQVVLLAGYAYSDWVTHHLTPRRQAILHIALLAISLSCLPIIADPHWKPSGDEDPSLLIIRLLLGTIGLPYFLLSTTGPLIQSWVSRTLIGSHVYRYFSLSNLASLIALICYPFLIERHAAIVGQAWGWSAAYAAFAILCAASAIYFVRHAHALPPEAHARQHTPEGDWDPTLRDYLLWLTPAAMGSWLLVAITNHITQNVAAIPFLWLLPLTLYLLTFVLCFESDRWYRRKLFLPVTATVLGLCAYGLQASLGFNIWTAIPLYAAGVFVICMFLHGELARLRPGPRHLTRFYLMVSLGGALGGIVVGLIAPRVLPAYYELGIGLVITALLAVSILRRHRSLQLAASALAACCAYFLYVQIHDDFAGSRRIERNFYGTLITLDTHRDDANDDVRQLYHGSVKHGEQFLAPARRREATAYYGASAGVGLAIANTPALNKKVGVIGLGAGTLAVYGQPGDNYRMYEINPEVIELAQNEFSFMADSKATIATVLGDARLSLEREAPQNFDVLAVDAFSGDSIPVHLITTQAMDAYLRHMKPDGIIAFHITNRFLRLAPVVANIAAAKGLHTAFIHDENDNPALRNTDWILVARNPAVLAQDAIRKASSPLEPMPALGVWTDDFNNLFEVLK